MRRTGARAHVLHLSDAGSLDLVRAAKAEGLPLTVETCPHYLSLRAEDVPDAATQFKCCPPIRDAGNQDLLWAAVLDGTIDAIVSDHSPSTADLKNDDFGLSWGGIAGLQLGLSAVWTEARSRGIALEDLLPLFTTGPARVAGLTGLGALEVGAPAHLVAFAPDERARGRRARPRAQEPGLALRRRDARRGRADRVAATACPSWRRGAVTAPGRGQPACVSRQASRCRCPSAAATSASTPATSIPTPTPWSPPTVSSSAPTAAPTRISATASARRAQPSPGARRPAGCPRPGP